MAGFIPTPADGWPSIAEALTHPWPEAAAVTDMRWHIDRAAFKLFPGKRREDFTAEDHDALRATLPGRPHFMKRWGWTDWRVFKLRSEPVRWWDDVRFGPQVTNSSPTADQQLTNSSPTATERENLDTSEGSNSRPTADQQPTNSSPPSRDPSSDHKYTNHPHENKKPKRERKTKTPPGESKNKNPFTEAWSKAWATATDGQPYPWGSYFRALAVVKELPPPADPEKLEAEMLRAIRGGTTDFTRWAWKAKDSHRRTLVKAPTETTDDLLALFGEPEPPQVSAPQPPPKPAYDPMKDCNSPEYREREMQELARERAERAEIRKKNDAARAAREAAAGGAPWKHL